MSFNLAGFNGQVGSDIRHLAEVLDAPDKFKAIPDAFFHILDDIPTSIEDMHSALLEFNNTGPKAYPKIKFKPEVIDNLVHRMDKLLNSMFDEFVEGFAKNTLQLDEQKAMSYRDNFIMAFLSKTSDAFVDSSSNSGCYSLEDHLNICYNQMFEEFSEGQWLGSIEANL